MVLLEPDGFLSELTKLFQKARLNGSVSMTFKKYDGHDRPKSKREPTKEIVANEPKENLCLLRARFRSKKLSTVVHQKEVTKFLIAYSTLLKANLDGLKRLKKPKKTQIAS